MRKLISHLGVLARRAKTFQEGVHGGDLSPVKTRRVARPRAAPGRRATARMGCGPRAARRAAMRGMTLVEIMIVVAIIGMVVGGVAYTAFGQFEKAKLQNAKKEVASIKGAIEIWSTQNIGQTITSLDVLVKDRVLNKDPKDPWGLPYQFKCPGEHDTDSCDVWSSGKDKKAGTTDDIKSW